MADFEAPRIGISRVYTRTGDAGTTGLVGGTRVPKDDVRIEAYGTVDELGAHIGLARARLLARHETRAIAADLLRVQHDLFNTGSILATPAKSVGPRQPRVRDADIQRLEAAMDTATATLPELRSFVLAGPSQANAQLHVARTVCRRAERLAVRLQREFGGVEAEVRYLNRLSDALFVWAREASRLLGESETLWDPNVTG